MRRSRGGDWRGEEVLLWCMAIGVAIGLIASAWYDGRAKGVTSARALIMERCR